MLKSYRLGACALAAAVSFAAGTAQADNHVVMIVDGGYFPDVTYAKPGDNLVFENKSGASHTLSGPEGSWASDPIANEGRFILNLKHDTPLEFSGETVGGTVVGEISYEEPPLAN